MATVRSGQTRSSNEASLDAATGVFKFVLHIYIYIHTHKPKILLKSHIGMYELHDAVAVASEIP